jgi:hypothetical protein
MLEDEDDDEDPDAGQFPPRISCVETEKDKQELLDHSIYHFVLTVISSASGS